MSAAVEILFTCPHCGTPKFTRRGLTAHRCDARGGRPLSLPAIHFAIKRATSGQPALSMPKAKSSSPVPLTVIGGSTIVTPALLAKLKKSVAKQITLVMGAERMTNHRRLFIGLGLIVIKGSLKHGEWLPWLKKHAPGSSLRQCHYMMRAARAWIEEQNLGDKDLAALPASGYALDLKSAKLSALSKSAADFVGDMTWGELLDKHGIREEPKLGGKRDQGADDGKPAPADPEQLYFQYRDEIGGVLTTAEQLLLKDNALQHLAGHPEEIKGVVEGLRALADRVEAAAKPLIAK